VQVLVNLLTNAAKYTPAGGHLVLTVACDQDVRVTVTDNGQGMSSELVDQCFDMFVQAKRTSDREQGGLGIGLALVKNLVELHGGDVRAQSSGLDRGSCFTVTLPRAVRTPDLPSQAPPQLLGSMLQRKKVLILDDNKDAAEMLGMLLESLGHEVMLEYHPRAALARIGKDTPDICLVDIGLPEMNGYEFARTVRASSTGQVVTLIAVTGYGQPEDREKGLATGFDHYLVKPVDANLIIKLLS